MRRRMQRGLSGSTQWRTLATRLTTLRALVVLAVAEAVALAAMTLAVAEAVALAAVAEAMAEAVALTAVAEAMAETVVATAMVVAAMPLAAALRYDYTMHSCIQYSAVLRRCRCTTLTGCTSLPRTTSTTCT